MNDDVNSMKLSRTCSSAASTGVGSGTLAGPPPRVKIGTAVKYC